MRVSSPEGLPASSRHLVVRISTLLIVLALASGAARAQEAAPESSPGMALRARLEARLRSGGQQALRAAPGHYGLLFPLEQDDLAEFMQQIWCHRDGDDFVLGTEYGAEIHGGGLLALLLEHWKPSARRARLGDRFFFERSRTRIALEEIYRGYRRQVFLPLPGREPAGIAGELPDSPQLPRMRFRYWTADEPLETDAYELLGLLVAHEPDASATWRNHLGQDLSVERLLRSTQDYYLARRSAQAELRDHSNLHLVELLLAWSRRQERPADAEAIKRRFLEVELAREEFADDGSEILAHYVESLGRLLRDPRLTWQPRERQRVRDWLRRLERERFDDPADVPILHLAHLLRGLRWIAESRGILEPGSPAVSAGSRSR